MRRRLLGWSVLALLAQQLVGCDRDRISFTHDLVEQDVVVEGVQTVRVGEETFVLAGVSTPRPAPEASCWAEAVLARETRAALESLTHAPYRLHASEAAQLPSGEIGARVEVNGRDLSEALLEAGLAAPSVGGERFNWCAPVDMLQEIRPRLNYPVDVSWTSRSGGPD